MSAKVVSVPTVLGSNSPISPKSSEDRNDRAVVQRLLTEALVLLTRNAAPDMQEDEQSQELKTADSVGELLDQLRTAHHRSVWGVRTHDDDGERLAFGLLAKPSSHEVVYRSTDVVDLVFRDCPSPAERAGVMRCSNGFNLVMYMFYMTIGNLMFVTVVPMGLLIMTQIWEPGEDVELALLVTWILFYGFHSLWLLCYIFSYLHLHALAAKLREQPDQLGLIFSRLVYTMSCCYFSPTPWNVASTVDAMIGIMYEVANDACLVFFRLRQTRQLFIQYFVPGKGCKARLQFLLMLVLLVWDVARHMAVLYAEELQLEAKGYDESLADLSVAGRAFRFTLKDLVNSSYTASMMFQLHSVLNSLKGFGRTVSGSSKLVVNTK
eukprot:TRINITY_DN29660_c0_g1_i1.p1 TRINITY_DN29660_c0_g1~~TRINITY_DN29660_c0_g1_i1.p1  ORF type:complete len:379 (+),score=25.36 TRINITY_DN29660_c0_g1_i1:45-1181(+)